MRTIKTPRVTHIATILYAYQGERDCSVLCLAADSDADAEGQMWAFTNSHAFAEEVTGDDPYEFADLADLPPARLLEVLDIEVVWTWVEPIHSMQPHRLDPRQRAPEKKGWRGLYSEARGPTPPIDDASIPF